MRRLLLAACIPMLFFAACDKEKPAMSKAQIARIADSIATMRIKELDERAQRDLEYRMKIELKGKSDSIIAASANSKTGENSKNQIPNPKADSGVANSKVQIPNPKTAVENSKSQNITVRGK